MQCKLKGKVGMKTNEYTQAMNTCRSLIRKEQLTLKEVRFGDSFSEIGITASLNMELDVGGFMK